MDAFAEQRNAANLRSIVRSDPSVLEILETSVHSTIYHYVTPEGASDGEWIKQKAEGPMFIVRRNTVPEHAVFMLNRATVKNVTIPLIKGEMKAKAVGEGMLQVARRGEKVKRGVWFAEAPAVERFQEEITRICGPPSQRPDLAANSSPVPQPGVPVSSGGNDGFSRLFAGLMTNPSGGLTPPMKTPQFAVPSAPIQRLPSPPQPQELHQPIPASSTSPFVTSPQASPLPPPPLPAELAQPPPAANFPPPQTPFTPPPGQTVDDLLNSILGVNPLSSSKANVISATAQNSFGQVHEQQRQQQHQQQQNFQEQQHQRQQLQEQQQQQYQHRNSPLPQRQILAGAPAQKIYQESEQSLPPAETAPPIPLDTKPETYSNHGPSPSASARQPSSEIPQMVDLRSQPPTASPSLSIPAPFGHSGGTMNANDLLAGIHSSMNQQQFNHSPIPSAPAFNGPPHQSQVSPRLVPPSALLGSVVDALGGMPDLRPGGRAGFLHVLGNLVRNEPRFVDDIWEGYLRRMGGG